MQTILDGIYSRYSNDATLSAAVTGMHFEQAPQDAVEPYIVYQLVAGHQDRTFKETFEQPDIQFDIYAATDETRQTAWDALVACYDDAKPTVTGYTSVSMTRGAYFFTRDGLSSEFYRATVTYECDFEKN